MDVASRDRTRALALALPALAVFLAFWLLPMVRLAHVGATGEEGLAAYTAVITHPSYFRSLVSTVTLSALTTVATLILSLVAGLFLQRNHFTGRDLLVSLQHSTQPADTDGGRRAGLQGQVVVPLPLQ